jgi:arsenate reductase-like glutaredoxin family protein
MSKTIDWLYRRKSCITCKRAEAYIEGAEATIKEMVDANKTKYGNEEALELLAGVDRIISVRGKKVEVFDLKNARPDDATLLAHLIGPTGNLRAPTARIGRTMVVGFSDATYQKYLGE